MKNRFSKLVSLKRPFLLLGILYSNLGWAQDFEVTSLNKHFYKTLTLNDSTTVYSEIHNENEDGSTFTQISDAQNRVVKTIQTAINAKTGNKEEVVKIFDADGNLIVRKEESDQDPDKFTFYYEDGIQVGHVAQHGSGNFEIWRKSGANRYVSKRNDFEPSFFPNDRDWKKFVMGERKFLSEAQKKGLEGTVILAFLIDENGQRIKTEIANPAEVPEILKEEAMRIGMLFKGNYNPAINTHGETMEAWLYLPVGFYFYK